jgi:hypothetical protein
MSSLTGTHLGLSWQRMEASGMDTQGDGRDKPGLNTKLAFFE